MASGLKAIETEYKGYRFRSRIEARWAVFFDAIGVAWEYEKEGYELGAAGRYLPDFWLPRQGYWIEIKGSPLAHEDRGKIRVFARGMPSNEVFLFDRPDFRVPYMDAARGFSFEGAWGRFFAHDKGQPDYEGECAQFWVQCTECMMERRETFGIAYSGYMKRHAVKAHGWLPSEPHCGSGCNDTRRLVRAYQSARQARFEFGESGAPS